MRIRVCLLFFLTLFLQKISAQEYAYAHYDVKEGLASSLVYSAVQDKQGFMWFATDAGLSRFDGSNFKNFTVDDGLPDNEILKLFVDSKNRIWIIPFRHELCFYQYGKIHTAKNDSLLASIKLTGTVSSIAEDSLGNLLILSANSIYYLHGDSILRYINRINGEHFDALCVGLNEKGQFRAAIALGHNLFSIVDLFPDREVVLQSIAYYGPTSVNWMIMSKNLNVVCSQRGVDVKHDGQLSHLSQPPYFIGTSQLSDSVFSLNSSLGTYIHNARDVKRSELFLPNQIVNSVMSDDEQNWWFCTKNGIFRLLSRDTKHFPFELDKKPSTIYSIEKIDSTIYLGTDKYTVIKLNGDHIHIEKVLSTMNPWRVNCFAKSASNRLFIGGDNGILLYEPVKKMLITSQSVKSAQILGDTVLIATNVGVNKLNWKSDDPLMTSRFLWETRATAARELSGSVYVGTLGGLYKITAKKEKYFFGAKWPQLSSRISGMTIDQAGMLWVATYDAGLVGIRNDSVVQLINTQNGLRSNTCRTLFADSDAIWVATNKGVARINTSVDPITVTRYTTADGLPEAVINAIYVDHNFLYVGTADGLARLNASTPARESRCRLVLTGVQIGQDQSYYDTSHFLLKHNYEQLRFDYSGIAYKSSGDIVYHYRMVGLNDEWQTTASNFLTYPSLPSGKYTLEIYAVNKFGAKSNKLSIPFGVKKLFRETLWFQLLLLLLLIAAVWLFILIRGQWIRRRQKARTLTTERIAELEQMALKAQMNPHFIFNCLNSIQQFVLEKDFEGVNKFITDFAKLIRKTLDTSAKKEISLQDELDYISTYLRLEKARLEDKFSFQIYTAANVNPAEYFIPPMILQPCLENSIRHGVRLRPDNLGMINVNIRRDADFLYCIIEDNGVGRSMAREYRSTSHIEYQSKGMDLTLNRIELLSLTSKKKAKVRWEDILNDAGEVDGTRVTIQFPLEHNAELTN